MQIEKYIYNYRKNPYVQFLYGNIFMFSNHAISTILKQNPNFELEKSYCHKTKEKCGFLEQKNVYDEWWRMCKTWKNKKRKIIAWHDIHSYDDVDDDVLLLRKK